MTSRRLIALLCVMMGAHTFCVGSFPVLLPEIGGSLALAEWQLGLLAGAFGFARMVSDIPAGLLTTHHLRRTLIGAPVLMLTGAAFMGSGAGFGWLLFGRVLMGVGDTLGMLGTLTTILKIRAAGGLASALNALEFSAMLAVLGGVTVVGLLPRALPWNLAFLIGCAPLLLGVAALTRVLKALPPTDTAQPWFARTATERSSDGGDVTAVALAFAAGGAIAVTYSTVASFLLPLRGTREFGLDRGGVAHLLMLAQMSDIVALLPVGALADARGTPRVLAGVLLAVAAAIALIGLGALPYVVGGCVLFGVGMAGWMLPLSLLRSATPASRVAWRAALYRVCVDGGIFLGPVLSGMLAPGYPRLMPAMMALALGLLAAVLAARGLRDS